MNAILINRSDRTVKTDGSAADFVKDFRWARCLTPDVGHYPRVGSASHRWQFDDYSTLMLHMKGEIDVFCTELCIDFIKEEEIE